MNDNISNTPKLVIQKHYENNLEKFVVFANVLVPPFSTIFHNFSKDGWTVIPTSGGTEYYKEFGTATSTPKEWIASVESLNRLLLAYFISDFAPRKVYDFELPGHIIQNIPDLAFVFGTNSLRLPIEERYKLASEMSGTIFNGLPYPTPQSQPDVSTINEWYDIFNDEVVYNCVSLIKEAFILINKQFSTISFDYIELAMGILLLVSALESLFTSGQENNADIKFKFSLVGSLFYQKNVTIEFLKRFENNALTYKFTQGEFRTILSKLYDLRSDVAHGSYEKIFKGKHWKELLAHLKVNYKDNFDKVILSRHATLALGLLQRHIFALIIQSKDDLSKGIKIINEIKI